MNPWPATPLTERLRLEAPIIQAPMAGGVAGPELAAAASKAGALGSLGAGLMQPDEIKKAIREIREATRRPFAINLFFYSMPHEVVSFEKFVKKLKSYEREAGFSTTLELEPPPSFEKQVSVLMDENIPVFSFTFGIPPVSVIRDFHKRNTLVIGTATNPNEAAALQEMGVDFIVCQGSEAGGHRGTFLGSAHESLFPVLGLVEEVKARVKRPLIAAGGIMAAADIREALTAGACAVQMGTAFVTCKESGAHPAYKKALLERKEHPTELTRCFSGRWGRVLENRFVREMEGMEEEIPPYPLAQSLIAPMRKAAAAKDNVDFMALWAGENFRFCESLTAQELIARLTLEFKS